MRIGVYSNPQKDPDGRVEAVIYETAKHNGVSAETYDSTQRYDFVVSIGGDGTILRVVKDCVKSETPILGVNRGTLGFLTEIEPNEADDAFKKLLSRDYILERRALIDVTFADKHYYALNDAVIRRSGGGRMITMSVRVNDEIIDKFTCDGYIASTPTGSTAYSLSAGGPILAPDLECIEFTALCPHTLFNRPMIFSDKQQISVRVHHYDNSKATFSVDGGKGIPILEGDVLRVSRAQCSLKLIEAGEGFYGAISSKLMAPMK